MTTPLINTLGSLGFVNVATPGSPVVLSATPLFVSQIRLQPRASASSLNVGNVYLILAGGNKAIAKSIYGVYGPEQIDVPIPFPRAIDLSTLYLDVDTGGDGALVAYAQ